MIKKFFIIILLITIVSLQVGCESNGRRLGQNAINNYNQNPLFVELPETMERTQAIDLAESAFMNRKWNISSKIDNEVVGSLLHRGFDAKARIKYEDHKLVIYSESSTYHEKQTGKTKPGVPYGWLKNLQADIVNLTQ